MCQNPKGPCTHIVYTLALTWSLYRYIGAKVYTFWVHGPLGEEPSSEISLSGHRLLLDASELQGLGSRALGSRALGFGVWGLGFRV